MIALTNTTTDGHVILINNIKDLTIRYATMVIGYQMFHSSRMNNVPSTDVHATYKMIEENANYDLCEAIRSQSMLNLNSIENDNTQKFKYGQLLIGLFFYFQNFLPGISDIQWSKDTPVTTQIKNNIKVVKHTFSISMNIYFNEFQKNMSMRWRLQDEVVKHFQKDIFFIVTTNFCLMEVVEPRQEEMEEMSYEVNYDLLIGYANKLLASLVDKKKRRLRTYQEQIAPAQPSTAKEKKKKVEKAPSVSTGNRVARNVQVKKKPTPKVYEKKKTATKKISRQLILQVDSEDIDIEEKPKKTKATGKKAKPVGEIVGIMDMLHWFCH